MPRKNKKNVAANNNAAITPAEKKKENRKKLSLLISNNILKYIAGCNIMLGDYLKEEQNYPDIFRKQIEPFISRSDLDSLASGQVNYSDEERDKILQSPECNKLQKTMAKQFSRAYFLDQQEKDMEDAKTAFQGTSFTTRTIQMTMMRNALQEAMDENSRIKDRRPPAAKDLENYMKKLKNLDASIDVYLSYKKEHLNGKTATARFEAAKKLKQQVKQSMLMLNAKIHIQKKEPLTDAYLKVSAEERVQMLAKRIDQAYTQYPESRYRRMKAFAEQIQSNLSKDKNRIAPVDIKEQKAMLAAALVSEKDCSVWKGIQEKGYTVPGPGSRAAGKPGVREKMMQMAEQNEMLAKEDNAEVLLNMKPEEVTKPILSILKAEKNAAAKKNQPDPDFYELLGM